MFLHSLLALAAAFPADTTSTRYLDYYRGIMSLASLPQSAADLAFDQGRAGQEP